MVILLPNLQQAARATPASAQVAASDQPFRLSVRASPTLIPAAPIAASMPALTSIGQSGVFSSHPSHCLPNPG